MNYFENKRTNRRESACGYCRTVGHMARECPQVSKDYAYWKDFIIPLQAGNPCHWYNANTPKYWGEWYTKCIETMKKQLDYAEKSKQPKKRRVIKNKTCGFCGRGGHNRRNCHKMKIFLADAYKANENWRRAAYDLLVKKLGLSVGAAIEVENTSYYSSNKPENKIALVKEINWDQLNVTCANSRYGDYRQGLSINVLVDGRTERLSFDKECLQPTFLSVVGWGCWRYVKPIATAPKPLNESWVTDYKDAFDYLTKKRTLTRLQEEGLTDLVAKWG